MQIIYTDGACKGNGKKDTDGNRGGYGVFYQDGNTVRCVWDGEPSTTNNRMELMAIITALQISDPKRPTTIYSLSLIHI